MKIARGDSSRGRSARKVYAEKVRQTHRKSPPDGAGVFERSGPPISLRASATTARVPSAFHRR